MIWQTTRFDTDWVPFEIEKAVDSYGIPIIVAYTVFDKAIRTPSALAKYWPPGLAARINSGTASAIHIPFKQAPIYEAIDQFSVQSNAGADSGRNGGSAVNLVIKSGTNAVHGSVFYFNRNEALAALEQ